MTTLTVLYLALVALVIDSALELATISSMVGYLHHSAANKYPFEYRGLTYRLCAKPEHLLLDEGHTSNGAAGGGIVLSIAGILVLYQLRRQQRKVGHSLYLKVFCLYR